MTTRSLEDVDLYSRAARAAQRQLAFCIIGSLVLGVLALIGYTRPFGWILIGLVAFLPFAAMRVADPTRWGSLRHLANTGEERRTLLIALRTRLADPKTPTIATKYGALYLLSDMIVFIDSADVEVMWMQHIARVSNAVNKKSNERGILFELKNGETVAVPMETAQAAAGTRRVEEHLGQGRIAPVAA